VVPISRWEAVPTFLHRRTTTMLCLGIDQHARQITISLRDESGDVLQARQGEGQLTASAFKPLV
jgi:hypothetical protein